MSAKKGDKHPKMKGNKFAAGNNGGRSRKFKKSELPALGETLKQFFIEGIEKIDTDKQPLFISSFCRVNKISFDTLSRYCEQDKEFCEAYKEAKRLAKELLMIGGLKGYFHPTAFVFVAKNETDMKDKVETDITSGGQPLPVLVRFIDGKNN